MINNSVYDVYIIKTLNVSMLTFVFIAFEGLLFYIESLILKNKNVSYQLRECKNSKIYTPGIIDVDVSIKNELYNKYLEDVIDNINDYIIALNWRGYIVIDKTIHDVNLDIKYELLCIDMYIPWRLKIVIWFLFILHTSDYVLLHSLLLHLMFVLLNFICCYTFYYFELFSYEKTSNVLYFVLFMCFVLYVYCDNNSDTKVKWIANCDGFINEKIEIVGFELMVNKSCDFDEYYLYDSKNLHRIKEISKDGVTLHVS